MIEVVGEAQRTEAHRTSNARSAALKGISEPIEVVNVDWR